MKRDELLKYAAEMVCGNREQDYGTPERNFDRIAEFWTTYLGDRLNVNLTAMDVAAMMSLIKLARFSTGRAKEDNWVDLAGYAACGGEIQTKGTATRGMEPVTAYGGGRA